MRALQEKARRLPPHYHPKQKTTTTNTPPPPLKKNQQTKKNHTSVMRHDYFLCLYSLSLKSSWNPTFTIHASAFFFSLVELTTQLNSTLSAACSNLTSRRSTLYPADFVHGRPPTSHSGCYMELCH